MISPVQRQMLCDRHAASMTPCALREKTQLMTALFGSDEQ